MNDKWGRQLFTAGAVLMVLLGLVHALSLIRAPVPANETERQLFHLMDTYRFNLMGSMRSMTDLFRGFSMAFTVASLGLGVLDLTLARERPALLKRVALVNIVWLAALVGIALKYFFAVPLTLQVVALLIFAAAWLKLPSASPDSI
jgi:hypothetical protein